jgi:hypothetical protein
MIFVESEENLFAGDECLNAFFKQDAWRGVLLGESTKTTLGRPCLLELLARTFTQHTAAVFEETFQLLVRFRPQQKWPWHLQQKQSSPWHQQQLSHVW